MVVNGGARATMSESRVAEVAAEVVRVQGGLIEGRGAEEDTGKGGRPCWVRTMV
jgi:hypothetical protein